jgi:hypothetical protein
MAEFLCSQITEDCFLVPAPQHTGKAEYTLRICEFIKEWSDYSIVILDVLSCTPRDTLYNLKKQMQSIDGIFSKEELEKISSGMFLKDDLKDIDLPIYFVDNVIATGTTLRNAQKLIPNIEPLVFAIDYNKYKVQCVYLPKIPIIAGTKSINKDISNSLRISDAISDFGGYDEIIHKRMYILDNDSVL